MMDTRGIAMTENGNETSETCDGCEHFLRMYKGAGVGTCRRGSKKYRSEDSICDFVETVVELDVDSVLSGVNCFCCGSEILETDLSKEHSIGGFDDQGKEVHYYCTGCWQGVDKGREEVRRNFDIE
jgi:hypothetical protein